MSARAWGRLARDAERQAGLYAAEGDHARAAELHAESARLYSRAAGATLMRAQVAAWTTGLVAALTVVLSVLP